MGHVYPFELTGARLAYRGKTANSIYDFFLAVSCAEDLTAQDNVWLPRIFERVVSLLAAAFLGPGGQCMHIGAPRDDATTFKDAMASLAARTGEYDWNPDSDYLHDQTRTTGDEGVDFIVWKPTGDGRPGTSSFLDSALVVPISSKSMATLT